MKKMSLKPLMALALLTMLTAACSPAGMNGADQVETYVNKESPAVRALAAANSTAGTIATEIGAPGSTTGSSGGGELSCECFSALIPVDPVAIGDVKNLTDAQILAAIQKNITDEIASLQKSLDCLSKKPELAPLINLVKSLIAINQDMLSKLKSDITYQKDMIALAKAPDRNGIGIALVCSSAPGAGPTPPPNAQPLPCLPTPKPALDGNGTSGSGGGSDVCPM